MIAIERLSELQCAAIKNKHREHYLFKTHIEIVLNAANCFKAYVDTKDYSRILIHSCLPNASNSPYQSLSDAIEFIKSNPYFFETSFSGCLNGQQVQHYLGKLNECKLNLQKCFEEMGDCFLFDKGESHSVTRNEVTDGMHRLVAYGLVSNMDESYFPIVLYWGTNKPLQNIE